MEDFLADDVFKVLVQQKDGTDSSYIYPDQHPLVLEVNEDDLTPRERKLALEIEKELGANAGPAAAHPRGNVPVY